MKLKNKRKFILIGDNRQIPPIEDEFERDSMGFKVSKIFNKFDYCTELTIQQRQKDGTDLKELIKKFRENMHLQINFDKMANKFKNDKDILFYNNNSKELRQIIKGQNPIAVCFKNLTCLSFNWLIGSTKSNNLGYKVNELNIGDIVFFDWNLDNRFDHTGIFVRHINNELFESVEGNTSLKNDSNGGQVMYRIRKYDKTVLFVNPLVPKEPF